MIANYIKLSLRLLVRNPFFTLVNIVGLSVGFAVFLILWPFTQTELGSDRSVTDHEKIARVVVDLQWSDDGENWGQAPVSILPGTAMEGLMGHEQIAALTRCMGRDFIVSTESKLVPQTSWEIKNSLYADQNFFTFFDIPFLSGDRETALTQKGSLVVSKNLSLKLFGDENALGQPVTMNGKPHIVTGVFEDRPVNTHLQFDAVTSELEEWKSDIYQWPHLYIKTKGDLSELTTILVDNKDRMVGRYLKNHQNMKMDLRAEPLEEVAFSGIEGSFFRGKSMFMLNVLAAVSLLVLAMAWMNYVNLTISRTKTRFKEIAARKVSGALIPDLLLQFICQSAVINSLAFFVAVTIIQLVRQPFEFFLNIRLVPFSELSAGTLIVLAAIFLSGMFATALYPALMMGRYNTRQLLTRSTPRRKTITTSLLTTFQYFVALTLTAWIFVMNTQLNFILDKDLGIDKENIIVMEAPLRGLEENGTQKMVSFAQEVRSALKTDDAALSHRVCGDMPLRVDARRVGKKYHMTVDTQGIVDEYFIPLYKLKLLAGRNFVEGDNTRVIIMSRAAAERVGFKSPEEAIGTLTEYQPQEGVWVQYEVIGVIEDYRMSPFYGGASGGQFLVYLDEAAPQRLSVRLSTDRLEESINTAKKIFDKNFPSNNFNWYFLDEHVASQYGDHRIARNQVLFFTILAVCVACLGLLGMIANTATERTKEIGVRRILGAGMHHISALLLRPTSLQVVMAVTAGLPLAWKFSETYLTRYSERIQLEWWHFVLPVVALLVIMLATISSVLWRATANNPVEALKHE